MVGKGTRELALSLSSLEFKQILHQLAGVRPVLVIGLIEIEDSKIYNTAVVVKEGQLIGAYRKVKLYGGESDVFEPGSDFPVFETEGLKFGINICYDLNFPECTEAVSRQGVDLLVCPCNNMMSRENAEKWKSKHNVIRARRSPDMPTSSAACCCGTAPTAPTVATHSSRREGIRTVCARRCIGTLRYR